MKPVYFMHLPDHQPVRADIFGEDRERLFSLCRSVARMWLYPYRDTYVPREKFYESEEYKLNGMEGYTKFLERNPELKEAIRLSRVEWDAKKEAYIWAIEKIARRHHCHIRWDGDEQFTVYRRGKVFGRVYAL